MENLTINPLTISRLKHIYPDIVQHIVDHRPKIYPNESKWCCLSGNSPIDAIMGCGNSEYEALEDWEKSFKRYQP